MEIAAIILSIVSLLMSGAVLVIYLAKHVYSTHSIQMVPVESALGELAQKKMGEEFEEFDGPSAMDVVLDKSH